jgi:hypothetical protein
MSLAEEHGTTTYAPVYDQFFLSFFINRSIPGLITKKDKNKKR